jgi:hypothetical protein
LLIGSEIAKTKKCIVTSDEKPKIFKVDIQSDGASISTNPSDTHVLIPSLVLSRVRSFLPQLKAENEKLFTTLSEDPTLKSTFEIDNVSDVEEQYIELVIFTYKSLVRKK